MHKSQKKIQLVQAIQEYVGQNDLSAGDLFRLLMAKGADVSETTIRRIVKADAVQENFSLDVLQRVSSALFGVNDSPLPAEEIDSSELAELEGLRAVNALTNAALKEAQAVISQLEKNILQTDIKITELTELCDFFKSQLNEKDRQIDKLLNLLEK